jgi:hypothetical protein
MIRFALAAALALAAPAAAQYETPVDPPDPAAHLTEMLEIYEAVCLTAFPDDAAVAREMAARGAEALSAADVRRYLHDDPGVGWRIAGRIARFDLTVEAPPFHACGVRTLTAAGFPDMAPYRALADRFEAGGGYRSFGPATMAARGVRTTGAGEQRATADGAEALLAFVATPADPAPGQTAVEVRFVHQFAPRD